MLVFLFANAKGGENHHHNEEIVDRERFLEQIARHWGVMTLKGKVIVDAKYEKVEIRDNGIAMVTNITGETQTINLK